MQYAENAGIRIHYEVEGIGEPLVLVHGFTLNTASWYRNGYVAGLAPRYRLALVDVRGHGKSDKPHDAMAYADEPTVGDVIAVLDALGIERAHYFGYSMGGHIGFACAKLAPQRFATFVIGGYSPAPWPVAATKYIARLTPDVDGLIAWWSATLGPPSSERRAALRENDPEALVAMLGRVVGHPGFMELLPRITTPTFLYCGEADPVLPGVEQAAQVIPGARSLILRTLGHVAALSRSDLVLPSVLEFLAAHPLSREGVAG